MSGAGRLSGGAVLWWCRLFVSSVCAGLWGRWVGVFGAVALLMSSVCFGEALVLGAQVRLWLGLVLLFSRMSLRVCGLVSQEFVWIGDVGFVPVA